MRTVAKPISHLRLQRYHRWAMLWLTWFAAFLEAAAGFAPISQAAHKLAHRWLDRIEHLIVCIIILRMPRLRRLNARKGVAAHRLSATSYFRAAIGARLRRALRANDLHARIAALRQDIGALAAQLARRLPCGLTRRRPIRPRPEFPRAEPRGARHAPALCADTS